MECFTIITTVKGRLKDLSQTIEVLIKHQLIYGFKILVVDYDCPDNSAAYLKNRFSDNDKLIVVKLSNMPEFNKSHALNIGIGISKSINTKYNIIIDADTLITEDIFTWLNDRMMLDNFIIGPKEEDLTGFICYPTHIDIFYDEEFKGWGLEDIDFRLRLLDEHNLKVMQLHYGLKSLKHSDDERVKFYNEKNKYITYFNNLEKMIIKYFRKHNVCLNSQMARHNIQKVLGVQ